MFRVGYVFLAIFVPVVFSIMASLDFPIKLWIMIVSLEAVDVRLEDFYHKEL